VLLGVDTWLGCSVVMMHFLRNLLIRFYTLWMVGVLFVDFFLHNAVVVRIFGHFNFNLFHPNLLFF